METFVPPTVHSFWEIYTKREFQGQIFNRQIQNINSTFRFNLRALLCWVIISREVHVLDALVLVYFQPKEIIPFEK